MNSIVLMAGQQDGKQQNPMMSILFLVMIIGVFYFFMIRPQVKKQKEIKKFRSSLQKGDKVVTTGGIYGKIAEMKDGHALVEIAPDVRVKIDLAAILRQASDIQQQK